MGFKAEDLKALVAEASQELADRMEESQAKAREAKAGQVNPTQIEAQDEEKQWDPTLRISRACRYLYQSRGNRDVALEIAKKAGDHQVIKALATTPIAAGGAMVDGDFMRDVIEVLRPLSALRATGVRTLTIEGGSLTMPYGDAGATAAYVGENTNISKSEPTFGQFTLVPKKLAVVVPSSNELLNDSRGLADAFIRDDIAGAMAQKENEQLIRGTASATEPTSLKELSTNASQNFNAQATVSLANTAQDLANAILKLEEADVRFARGAWIMAPRTKYYLLSALDANGTYPFRDEVAANRLMGYPVFTTTSVPTNLGAGTDESEIYFFDPDKVLLGESQRMSLEAFNGAAYWDGANVVSGLSLDQTVLRAISRHDIQARYRGKEIALIEQVTWGA